MFPLRPSLIEGIEYGATQRVARLYRVTPQAVNVADLISRKRFVSF